MDLDGSIFLYEDPVFMSVWVMVIPSGITMTQTDKRQDLHAEIWSCPSSFWGGSFALLCIHMYILFTVTVIFSLAMFSMFPALFLPLQEYTVVPGVSVEAKYSFDDSWGIRISFLYHWIVGTGNPSAMQWSTNLVPTLIVSGEELRGSIVILGASAYYKNKAVDNQSKLWLCAT